MLLDRGPIRRARYSMGDSPAPAMPWCCRQYVNVHGIVTNAWYDARGRDVYALPTVRSAKSAEVRAFPSELIGYGWGRANLPLPYGAASLRCPGRRSAIKMVGHLADAASGHGYPVRQLDLLPE